MKTVQKRLIALALCLVMVLSLAACKLTDKDKTTDATAEIDRSAVVAEIGNYKVTLGELSDQYASMMSFYTNYGMAAPTAEADIESYQDMIMEGLVGNIVLLYQAEQMGISPLGEEDTAAVKATVDADMQALVDDYTAYATEQGEEDPAAAALTMINEDLTNYGYNVDFDGYKTMYEEEVYNAKVIEKLEETIKATVTSTEQDVQTYYDDLLAQQKESFDAKAADFITAAEDYEMGGTTPVLYTPEGFIRVKVISISPEGALDTDYETVKSEMTTLSNEYGELLLSGSKDTARIAEIKTQYLEKQVEAETLYAEYIKDAKEKTAAAYQELTAGKSFDEVLAAYGQDENYTTYPVFAEKGRLISKTEAADDWDETLRAAALALADGAYSAVIEQDGNFFIIERIGDEAAAELSFADVKDVLDPLVLAEMQADAISAQEDEWIADTSKITYYENVYRDVVGK